MDIFRLNWFLGVLAIELWGSAVVIAWAPELLATWRRYRRRSRGRHQFGRAAW